MEWVAALGGFALGLLSSYLILRVQRSWQSKDDAAYSRNVVESLITEIEEGIERAKFMAQNVSFSRIYIALWQSTIQRLAATLTDKEMLKLLHRIYYRFDLINFNCEIDRPEAGSAFAKQYVSEIEENLVKLRALLEMKRS